MKTIVHTVHHASQRYDTLGDWEFGNGTLVVTVSDTGDPRMNFLIALHEQIEAMLCMHRGIPEPEVYAFDVANADLDDPGSSPKAPYHKEHVFSENIERLVAAELGVNWAAYGDACEKTWGGK